MESSANSYSIQPISEKLDFEQSRHLLERCLFGTKKEEIESLTGKSISEAMEILCATPTAQYLPLSMDANDLAVTLGNTWINAPYNGTYNSYRQRSLRSWWIGNMMQQGISLNEKMVLFWHNHFVTEESVVNVAGFLYKYNLLLRKYALGNIKLLAYEMCITPAMLVYLNGESNKVGAPNENFARELFELFTIGKGPLIADGNYTNYTETDIREAAKVLTGWKVSKTNNNSYFDTARHDKTTKVFSDAFGKMNIQNKEAEEYKLLVDMIFSKKETARNIAREIYRWLMYYKIDQNIEEQIIEPLATTLFNNNYEIKPMLAQLLSSEHFFSAGFRGAYIKNPLEFAIGVYRKFEIQLSTVILNNYEIWLSIFYSARDMEMALGDPPDVAGWPQYYKEPSFNELWINSATVPNRTTFSNTICNNGITKNSYKFIIDPLVLTSKIADAANPVNLITGLAKVLFPVSVSSEKISSLKEVLIPGLPDSTWTFEWNKYISNPNDGSQKTLVKKKLSGLIAVMLKMPEFYLC